MLSDQISLLESAKQDKKVNESYLRALKTMDEKLVFDEVKKIHSAVFAKTNCLQCANCCKTTPALLTHDDIKRLANVLEISAKQFKRKYVLEDVNGEMTINGVPCRFLTEDNHCSVYEFRPEACRRFPHTDEKEYVRRTSLNLANTMICPAAYRVLEQLKKTIPLS